MVSSLACKYIATLSSLHQCQLKKKTCSIFNIKVSRDYIPLGSTSREVFIVSEGHHKAELTKIWSLLVASRTAATSFFYSKFIYNLFGNHEIV